MHWQREELDLFVQRVFMFRDRAQLAQIRARVFEEENALRRGVRIVQPEAQGALVVIETDLRGGALDLGVWRGCNCGSHHK